MESVGLAAAREAQKTIDAQKETIKELQDEAKRLKQELE